MLLASWVPIVLASLIGYGAAPLSLCFLYSFGPALRGDGDCFSGGGVGDQAEESHWIWAGVAELMDFARLDEDDVACGEFVLAVAFEDDAAAFEDEDFVLVVVAVPRGVAAGGDFELAHGEGGRAVGLAEEPADRAAGGAGHIDGFGGSREMT